MTTAELKTAPVPGRLEQRKARTRAAILAAAGSLFAEHGAEGTSIQQIAELASTGVGTVYGYFASKDEIIRAVLQESTVEAIARYEAAVNEETPALERVCTALLNYGAYIRENRRVLLAAFVTETRTSSSPDNWTVSVFNALIREGIEKGELANVPVDTTTRLILANCVAANLGLSYWHDKQDDKAVEDEIFVLVRRLLSPCDHVSAG